MRETDERRCMLLSAGSGGDAGHIVPSLHHNWEVACQFDHAAPCTVHHVQGRAAWAAASIAAFGIPVNILTTVRMQHSSASHLSFRPLTAPLPLLCGDCAELPSELACGGRTGAGGSGGGGWLSSFVSSSLCAVSVAWMSGTCLK